MVAGLIVLVSVTHAEGVDSPELTIGAETQKAESGFPELSASALTHGDEDGSLQLSASSGWQSKYISEGRDNIDGNSMFTAEMVAVWKQFSIGAWYGIGDSKQYQELDLFVEYGFSVSNLDIALGYARLEFMEDGTFDNELFTSLALSNLPYVVPGLDAVYSTEADGTFVELSLRSKFGFLNERLFLEPYVLQGLDYGYASDDDDGFNNTQVGVGLSYLVADRFHVVGSLNQSWANKGVRQDDGGDETWVSVGLAIDF